MIRTWMDDAGRGTVGYRFLTHQYWRGRELEYLAVIRDLLQRLDVRGSATTIQDHDGNARLWVGRWCSECGSPVIASWYAIRVPGRSGWGTVCSTCGAFVEIALSREAWREIREYQGVYRGGFSNG